MFILSTIAKELFKVETSIKTEKESSKAYNNLARKMEEESQEIMHQSEYPDNQAFLI